MLEGGGMGWGGERRGCAWHKGLVMEWKRREGVCIYVRIGG